MPAPITPLLTLAALAGSLLGGFSEALPPLAALHLAFAGGALPLILYAILQFVPVLTRSGGAGRALRTLPELARLAGLAVVAVMAGGLPRAALTVAAAVVLVIALLLAGWIGQRAYRCLGAPHPGWRWYVAALAALSVAMGGVVAMAWWPAAYAPLRQIHLHLNVLGLVGLAALGTLPVLLPTALGRADPKAAAWLHRAAWPATACLLATIGAVAGLPALAWLAGAGWLVLVLSLLRQWRAAFGIAALGREPAAAGLTAATVALGALLLAGTVQGLGLAGPGGGLVGAWALAFLLPLISSALIVLLPVWRFPGPASPARAAMRQALGAAQRGRVLAWLLAGGLWLSMGDEAGGRFVAGALAGLAMLGFLVHVIQAMRVTPGSR